MTKKALSKTDLRVALSFAKDEVIAAAKMCNPDALDSIEHTFLNDAVLKLEEAETALAVTDVTGYREASTVEYAPADTPPTAQETAILCRKLSEELLALEATVFPALMKDLLDIINVCRKEPHEDSIALIGTNIVDLSTVVGVDIQHHFVRFLLPHGHVIQVYAEWVAKFTKTEDVVTYFVINEQLEEARLAYRRMM